MKYKIQVKTWCPDHNGLESDAPWQDHVELIAKNSLDLKEKFLGFLIKEEGWEIESLQFENHRSAKIINESNDRWQYKYRAEPCFNS